MSNKNQTTSTPKNAQAVHVERAIALLNNGGSLQHLPKELQAAVLAAGWKPAPKTRPTTLTPTPAPYSATGHDHRRMPVRAAPRDTGRPLSTLGGPLVNVDPSIAAFAPTSVDDVVEAAIEEARNGDFAGAREFALDAQREHPDVAQKAWRALDGLRKLEAYPALLKQYSRSTPEDIANAAIETARAGRHDEAFALLRAATAMTGDRAAFPRQWDAVQRIQRVHVTHQRKEEQAARRTTALKANRNDIRRLEMTLRDAWRALQAKDPVALEALTGTASGLVASLRGKGVPTAREAGEVETLRRLAGDLQVPAPATTATAPVIAPPTPLVEQAGTPYDTHPF